MPKQIARESDTRPGAPSRASEKHERNVHALALASLVVVLTAKEARWPQRVPPIMPLRKSSHPLH